LSCLDFEIKLLISEIKLYPYLRLHIVTVYKMLTAQQQDLIVEVKISSKGREKGSPSAQEILNHSEQNTRKYMTKYNPVPAPGIGQHIC